MCIRDSCSPTWHLQKDLWWSVETYDESCTITLDELSQPHSGVTFCFMTKPFWWSCCKATQTTLLPLGSMKHHTLGGTLSRDITRSLVTKDKAPSNYFSQQNSLRCSELHTHLILTISGGKSTIHSPDGRWYNSSYNNRKNSLNHI